MIRALFICDDNRDRSPTADQVFSDWPGVFTESAAVAEVNAELLDWADLILVMEKRQRAALMRGWSRALRGKQVVPLDIPDRYTFMQPELVEILLDKAGPFLKPRAGD